MRTNSTTNWNQYAPQCASCSPGVNCWRVYSNVGALPGFDSTGWATQAQAVASNIGKSLTFSVTTPTQLRIW